jgi:predicted PurR-regulated permease PerM
VADATVIVLVVGVLVTVLVVAFVMLVLVQRVSRAYGEATRVIERLRPLLDGLTEQQQVTSRELARVGEAMDALGEQRSGRSRS